MLLRASGQQIDHVYDIGAIRDTTLDSGVEHGTVILQLTDALIDNRLDDLETLRTNAFRVMSKQTTIDALTVASAFNGITRVADATGIHLDSNTENSTEDIRDMLDINRFAALK